ncbi:Kelch repeat-containing protein [Pseudoalteromonas luteoviolacea]|uniref:Kelch repeat-containing protein n=1 Tax=Pseudoalteromonas luteoviolacea TaxID=43657 RepID=UPI001B35FF12|nr:kelch repeat-containing protein [Pseudoalteromonas luteoviolacea]MBQ4837814.1 hypothetical protein [Pseudoalteromonas luteoviolacea]
MKNKVSSTLSAMIVTLILQGCATDLSDDNPQEQAALKWQLVKMLPTPLQEVYPAVFKGKIYVAGAFEQTSSNMATLAHLAASNSTYVFDDARQAWLSGPLLPQSRHHLGLISSGDELYAIGGFDATKANAWQVKSSVYVMRDEGEAWQVGPELPIPMGESVYGALNGQIHVAGGRTMVDGKLTDTDAHWVLKKGHWSRAAPLPIASNSATSVVINEQWYVMGGRINSLDFKNLDNLWRYDPKEDRWQSLAPMPQPSAGLASAVINGQIYVFGGEEYTYVKNDKGKREMKTRTFDQIFRYDPATQRWATESLTMTSTRHGLGAVSLGNQIYLLGGAIKAGATGTSAIVERLSF